MRAWVGLEREGREKGVNTLFVESDCVLASDLYKIQDAAKKRGINRIYLGAGKRNVIYICKEWPIICGSMKVVIETTPNFLRNLTHIKKFKNVILRYDIQLKDFSNIVPKIDNGSTVAMYYDKEENLLDTLKDGIYTDSDQIIEL